MKRFFGVLALGMLVTSSLVACTVADKKDETEHDKKKSTEVVTEQQFMSKVDENYAYDFAKGLEQFKTNEKLGYRTAGSEAELQTGEHIEKEMKSLGLQEVTKDEITVDSWTFEKADLSFKTTSGKEQLAVLGGYQTNFNTNGKKSYEVVYANRGTADDLEKLDVKGKLVLIDINQREEWWINYPTYQAHLKGAAAVIAVQNGGYGEVDESALNAQDICGPEDAPAFSMSQKDAKELKKALKKNNNKLTVDFDAKSTVKMNQKTYNYYGKIEGKHKDEYILLSGHYDSYFDGFQDDNSAIGLMLGIAKAMKDSGYQPDKTIIFNALAAEEWGVSNSRYDWSTGAYNQIFKVHPEWAKQTFANINFELPAFEHMDTNEIRSVYEFKDFLTDFIPTVPAIDGIYKDGIRIVTPLQTWSDDFSFSIAGIPAIRNDFQDSQFMHTHYHSQYDNNDTYNKKVMKYHMNMYGTLAMAYDKQAVTPLHFTTRLDEMEKSVKEKIYKMGDVDAKTLLNELAETKKVAKELNAKVDEVNASYEKAHAAGDTKEADRIYKENEQLNDALLAAFKSAQDDFVRLTWEDEVIFPHEHAQNNIEALQQAKQALEKGKASKALDESLYKVDNNWYAYDYDREVYDYFTNYVTNQPADRLKWGAGRVMGHEDLYDVIASLQAKKDGANFTKEIKAIDAAIQTQQQLLKKTNEQEVKAVQALRKQLEAM